MEKTLKKLRLTGSIELLPSGYHSDVILHEDTGERTIYKIIRKKELVEKASAQQLSSRIIKYHALLQEINFPVTDSIENYLMESDRGWDVIIKSPYAGNDVPCHYRNGAELPNLAKKIVYALEEIFHHRTKDNSNELIVGIDSKPGNFCLLHSNGSIQYVDLVPPRYREADQILVEFDTPLSQDGFDVAYFRHYDIRGTLLVLQNQLSRLSPELRKIFKQIILATAKKFGVESFFKDSKWEHFLTSPARKKREIIESLTPKNMYDIREITCEIAQLGYPITDEEIQVIFRKTHFFNDLPTQKDLNEVKKTLLKIIRKCG